MSARDSEYVMLLNVGKTCNLLSDQEKLIS